MLTSTLTRRPREFHTVLATIGDGPPIASHSNTAVFKWYAQAVQERRSLATAVQRIVRREFGFDLTVPEPLAIDAAAAAGHQGRPLGVAQSRLKQYDTAFEESLQQCPYLGRVEYTGRHECVFRYCDSTKKLDALQIAHHIHTHEHHLVQVRERKLTDPGIVLPPKQQRIVAMLPDCALPHVRIVAGMLVLQKEGDGGTIRRDHVVGRGLRQVGAAAMKYGPATVGGVATGAAAAGIIAGLVSLIGAAATAATAAATTVAIVAATDPAIVLGDLVLSGWIEEE